MSRHAPPGWPRQIPPPGSEGWQERATNWLLDTSPAEYRGYHVLRRHPVLLAWLAERNVAAQLEAARGAYARARAELGDLVDPEVVAELLGVLESDGARLLALQRETRLVAESLRGQTYVPRL